VRDIGKRRESPRGSFDHAFFDIGTGARLWLCEAAEAGTGKIRVKMDHAVTLAKLLGAERVDWALGHAASYGRFPEGDLMAILDAHPVGVASDQASMASSRSSSAAGRSLTASSCPGVGWSAESRRPAATRLWPAVQHSAHRRGRVVTAGQHATRPGRSSVRRNNGATPANIDADQEG
jgi:hypothetical protein